MENKNTEQHKLNKIENKNSKKKKKTFHYRVLVKLSKDFVVVLSLFKIIYLFNIPFHELSWYSITVVWEQKDLPTQKNPEIKVTVHCLE